MKYFSYLDKLIEENRVLKFALLALGITNVLLALLYIQSRNAQKVVVVPPEIRREFWVAGGALSKSYLEQVFHYVTSSILNVSPETVDESLSRVYVFLTTDPALVRRIKDAFHEYARTIKERKVYQSFYPMEMRIGKGEVTVKGLLKKVVGPGEVETEERTVRYRFRVQGTRLLIEGIEL